jgi:hypothetical protein
MSYAGAEEWEKRRRKVNSMNTAKYARLHADAVVAGVSAAASVLVEPMVVVGRYANGREDRYVVEDGVCGFAGVVVSGQSGFGKYAKRSGLGFKNYPSGIYISVRGYGQSMTRKEAYAHAYAEVLNAAGVKAYVSSRMD